MTLVKALGPLTLALASLGGAALFLVAGWAGANWARRHPGGLARAGVALLGLCLGVRVALVLVIGTDGLYGSDPYPSYAENIASGRGFSDDSGTPTAYWPPGWPLVLGGAYLLFGVSDWTMLLVSSLIGGGLVLAIWKAASLLLGPGYGLLAANVAAWHPASVLKPFSFESDLLFEFLGAVALLCAVLLVRAVRDQGGRGAMLWGLALGLCSGLMLLTRSYGVVYFALICVIILAMLGPRRKRAVVPVLAAALLAGLALAGWTARNVARFSEPVVISANGGVNLWIGNHPGASLKFNAPALPDGQTQASLGALSEHQRDAVYRRAALVAIREDPTRFLVNGVKKAVLVYANDTAPISGFLQAGLGHDLSRAELVGLVAGVNGYYWSMLALAAAGWLCLVGRKEWFLAALLALAPTIVACIAFVFFAQGRFHWFAMPSLTILGVVGLAWWWSTRPSRPSRA